MIRLFSFIVAMLLAHVALADSIVGEFQPVDARWIHPNGTIGVAYSGGANITIDRNGNGIVGAAAGDPNDPVYTLPPEAQSGLNYFLSPTREFLYVTRSGTGGCGPGILNVRIYRLPLPVGPLELIHSDCLPCGTPYNGTPQFYDTGLRANPPYAWGVSARRLMFLVSRDSQTTCATPTARLALRIYDLNVPGAAGRAVVVLQEGWEPPLRVAQSGTACFVKHDLQSNPLDADYSLIDLCPGANFGQVLDVRNDVSGVVLASVSAAGGGILMYSVNDDGVETFAGAFPDCTVTSAPIGACCVAGACTQVVEALCAGTWAAGVSCTAEPCGPPPMPILSVQASGPASARALTPFSYSLVASNTGTLTASNITVRATAPTGATFVSSTGGDAGSSNLTWVLTSLAPGQSRTLTATFNPACSATSLTLSTYSIQSSATGTINGAPAVVTTVTSYPTDPVQITITATPSASPAYSGDTVEYAMTITNPSAADHQNLTMTFVSSGPAASYHQQIDAGGGTFTVFNATNMSWVGNVAPFGTTTVRFSTRIRDCIFSSDTEHRLNYGSGISLRNPCGVAVGTGLVPPAVPLIHPTLTTLQATNITPGLVGPASPAGEIYQDRTYQPVRRGAVAEVLLNITNTSPGALPTLAGGVTIPAEFTVNNPPFIGTPPAGVTYDSANRRIDFAVALPQGQSLSIPFAVSLTGGNVCENMISVGGGTSATCQNLQHDLLLMAVEPPPTRDHLIALDQTRGLWSIADGPLQTARIACPPREIWWGLARESDGDVWYAGLPLVKINPESLDFGIFQVEDRCAAVFNGLMRDAAWDTSTSTLLMLLRGFNGGGAIFRYDPVADVVTHIITDPALGTSQDLEADPDGAAIVMTTSGLRRIPIAGQTLPLSAGAGTTVPCPNPGLTFGGALGALQNVTPLRFAEVAPYTYVMTVNSIYREDLGAPGQTPYVASSVGSLYRVNPDGSTTMLVDQLSGYRLRVPSGIPTYPPALTPLFSVDITSSSIAATAPGTYALGGSVSPYFLAEVTLAPVAGRYLFAPTPFGFPLQDLVWVSTAPQCPADWTNDGGIDGDDVIAFFADWDAGHADFNGDSGTDGDDVIDFFAHWDAGC